jgi:hypothetical protein
MVEIRSNRWTPREDDLLSDRGKTESAYTIGLPSKWFKLNAKGKIISPDTKSPDSTSDIVSAAPPAARELPKPCQDKARRAYLTASGRSEVDPGAGTRDRRS